MSEVRKQKIRALLKSIETGDPAGIAVVDESRYIQHNPQTHEGSEGLAALFARLAKTHPRVNIVRAFSDGDFVFAHTEYDFSTRRIGFEVFRFEGDYAVEHWDNIQPRRGPNASGRSMVDGTVETTDVDRTEANRTQVKRFVDDVLIGRGIDRLADFVAADLVQHAPDLEDGISSLKTWLTERADGKPRVEYTHLHRILADGAFVLTVCEGELDSVHTSFYDLWRVDDGRLVEHWNTVEAVPPPASWKNDNGKF